MSATTNTAILAEHGFNGVKQVHGVTHDGEHAWFATTGKLHEVDPSTGQIVKELSIEGADAGTAFDGTHIWQLAGAEIKCIEPASGKVLSTIPAPDGGANASGMAWEDGYLWIGGWKDYRILKVDPATGDVLREIETDRFVTGVSWVEGQLWHGVGHDEQPAELRQVDPEDGRVLTRLVPTDSDSISGVEADNEGRIWFGSGDKLRAVARP